MLVKNNKKIMAAMGKIFLLIIFTTQATSSVFYGFDEDDRDNWNNCAYAGRPCDHKAENPCCDLDQLCTIAVKNERWFYECKQKARVEDYCENDLDCLELSFAICKNNKCQCISNYSGSNLSKCVPLLGGYCMNHKDCTVKDSLCDSNQCVCKPFYRSISNDRCIITVLGRSCEDDYDCEDFEHMQCSRNSRTCICRPFHVIHNNATCVPS